MSILGAGQFVNPDIVASHFHLHDGDKVADFGAGTGFYLKALGTAVGKSGRVYACEIQKNLVESLARKAQELHLMNVEPIWCDLETQGGTKLRDGILDAGILVNTLFQIEDKVTALTEIARTIRSGGKFFIIDWSESFGGIGPHPLHVVTESIAKELATAHGFTYERSFPAGDHHYGLAFRRI